jgi:hypothetical protein
MILMRADVLLAATVFLANTLGLLPTFLSSIIARLIRIPFSISCWLKGKRPFDYTELDTTSTLAECRDTQTTSIIFRRFDPTIIWDLLSFRSAQWPRF